VKIHADICNSGGNFAANLTTIRVNLRKGVTAGCKFPPVSTIPAVNFPPVSTMLTVQLGSKSFRKLKKNQNGGKRTRGGLGEDDS
jgi:hypothetical protein